MAFNQLPDSKKMILNKTLYKGKPLPVLAMAASKPRARAVSLHAHSQALSKLKTQLKNNN
jgi:hypothetical protein